MTGYVPRSPRRQLLIAGGLSVLEVATDRFVFDQEPVASPALATMAVSRPSERASSTLRRTVADPPRWRHRAGTPSSQSRSPAGLPVARPWATRTSTEGRSPRERWQASSCYLNALGNDVHRPPQRGRVSGLRPSRERNQHDAEPLLPLAVLFLGPPVGWPRLR